MGFSPFQLCMGCSPWVIPPLTELAIEQSLEEPDATAALALIERIEHDVTEAQDNLLAAKIAQAEFTNRYWANKVEYAVRDHIMLSTEHHRWEHLQKHNGCVAKFMPCFNSPSSSLKLFLKNQHTP